MMRLAVASRRTGPSLMPELASLAHGPHGAVPDALPQAAERGIRISVGLILRFPHFLCLGLWRLVHQRSYSPFTEPRPGGPTVTSPRTLRNFIGGAFVDSGGAATSDVVNP